MRTAPSFWWRDRPNLTARLLAPAGWAYGAATAHRMTRAGTRLPVPVLCVGNFVVGGAGKTPTAITLAGLLAGLGHRPAFLSRGYGRRENPSERVIAVDPHRHAAAEVGDEPLLLAHAAPTFVGRDRFATGKAAAEAGATVLILDDGLQSPTLVKDLVLAVVDGERGVGNGLCLPAGPLRAPLARQWPHVSALCVVGPGARGAAMAADARRRAIPVFSALLEPDGSAVDRLRGRPLHAFAGIGQPQKFFDTLQACGLELAGAACFPDHHRFTPGDLAGLRQEAARRGAALITTEKDRARLAPDAQVEVLPVRLVFDETAAMTAYLRDQLRPAPGL